MLKPKLFVSYSHDDQALVGPIVSLLRASHVVVFFDRDTLQPGKKWREQISQAISESSTVAVFWCVHSRYSREVSAEYQEAIRAGKDILPLLLDDAPLPEVLAEYQYIDLQPTVGAQHDGLRQSFEEAPAAVASAPSHRPSNASPAPSAKSARLATTVASALGLSLLLLAVFVLDSSTWVTLFFASAGIALLSLVVALALRVASRRARDRSVTRSKTADRAPNIQPQQYAEELARQIELEVLRRAEVRASEA